MHECQNEALLLFSGGARRARAENIGPAAAGFAGTTLVAVQLEECTQFSSIGGIYVRRQPEGLGVFDYHIQSS